jgi:hypothetical protein
MKAIKRLDEDTLRMNLIAPEREAAVYKLVQIKVKGMFVPVFK